MHNVLIVEESSLKYGGQCHQSLGLSSPSKMCWYPPLISVIFSPPPHLLHIAQIKYRIGGSSVLHFSRQSSI